MPSENVITKGAEDQTLIVVKELLPGKKRRIGLIGALATSALVALLLIGMLPIPGALLLGLIIGPLLYLGTGIGRILRNATWAETRDTVRKEAIKALKQFVGRKLLHVDGDAAHQGKGNEYWASGVAWDGEALYVMDKGVGARIPLSKIRGWTWNIDQVGTSGWFAIGTAADVHKAKAEAQVHDDFARAFAEAGNGLHVSVKDVGKPVWHFQTSDQQVLQRWQEILTQIFEERGENINS